MTDEIFALLLSRGKHVQTKDLPEWGIDAKKLKFDIQRFGGVLIGIIKILWDVGVAAFSAIVEAVNTVAWAIGGVISAVQEAIGWFQNLESVE